MDWWDVLIPIVAALLGLMAIGVPVAFAFLAINVVAVYVVWGGTTGFRQLSLSVMESVTHFGILPVPLFILMGELMFRSGIALKLMDVVDYWIGKVPGRLSLMAVGGGTLFGTLTGSGVAGTALLGKILTPDMEKRGYGRSMSIGPILGSGGLAIMIPPSALGVLLASIADISVGDFLMAIIGPGLLMAALYATYILGRCTLQPHIAPSYAPPAIPLWTKLRATLVYVFPLATIVFLVTGVIFLGIATPTEAAALGAVGALVVACAYGSMSFDVLKEALESTLMISVMMLMIITGSTAFSQVLAFTGASSGLVRFAIGLEWDAVHIVMAMQLILLLLGTFMEPLSILMLTIPIYFPIIEALGLSPIWFAAIMLLNMQMAATTPPFGLGLFVMRSVAPTGTTMGQIYKAAIPFLICDAIAMTAMILYPPLVLTLPGLNP